MASLYDIQKELVDLFDVIEDNGGEITEEQEALLDIKETELKEKLYKYYQAIKIWDNNYKDCKLEKKRINDTQKKYENRVNKLKAIMLDAVQQFGIEGKTNRFIELPTVRFSTRKTTSIEVDTDRIGILCAYATQLIQELYISGVIYTGADVDFEGILNSINANCIAEFGDEFVPFSLGDLESLEVEIVTKDSLHNFFINHKDALEQLGKDPINTSLIPGDIDKLQLKEAIKFHNISGTNQLTIAKESNNTSLIIK